MGGKLGYRGGQVGGLKWGDVDNCSNAGMYIQYIVSGL
jgi:hypothetical protein